MASQAARRIMPARTSSFADDNEVNRSLMARALQLFGRPPACARGPSSSEVDSRGDVSDKGPSASAAWAAGGGSQRVKPLSSSPPPPSWCSSEARSVSELDCLPLSPRSTRGSFRHLLISNYDFVK